MLVRHARQHAAQLAAYLRVRKMGRVILFGLSTNGIPFLLGTAVGLAFGYGLITAIVVGSLLASHTLLGSRIVAELGAHRLEPVTVTIGATLLSDTLVAFNTYDPSGQCRIDRRMLNVVLALMCTTATLGPVLTQHFAPRMLEDSAAKGALLSGSP